MNQERRLRALENQTHRLQRRLDRLHRISYTHSWVRFIIFAGAVLAAGLAFFFMGAWLSAVCLALGGVLFAGLVYVHRRVNLSIRRHELWKQVKSAHLARATLDWEQLPAPFYHQAAEDHPFEADLDLVGQRSLHRLIDTAVAHEGSQRLRDWLTAPVPDLGQTEERQRLVRELAPLHRFRDRLSVDAILAAGAKRTWRANHLIDWLERHTSQASLRRWLLLFGALAVLNAGLFLANRLGLLPPWWQFTIALYLALWLIRSRVLDAAADEAVALEGALRQLRVVFNHLETFAYYRTPHLQALCRPFLDADHRPSRYLTRMTRVLAAMGLRGNPILRLALNALLPWDAFFAYRLDRVKADLVHRAPSWMDAWFQLEALGSLANFAYLNPAYAFPELLDPEATEPAPAFLARGLGHPLIPAQERVCNNLTISGLGQVTVITGSNMAGKSVLLKTVGVNLTLAHAGAPVVAESFQVLPFRLFTSIGITDSVTNGISYFYAEVTRLKRLLAELELDHPLPLLFCIDEIFRGTNNRERLIGSRAYVRALAGKRGLGFIATHDLELARLAEEVPQVVNYHFRDHVVDGRMAFDYTLRPGPCPTTNALTIMQLEGLPVPLPEAGSESPTMPANGI